VIETLSSAVDLVESARSQGKTIGLCHGVFDVMHAGHIRHFQEAKASVDFLVVSITADAYVKKGKGRPFFSESKRAEVLASIKYVDLVVISTHESGESVIKSIKPNYYFKGIDYRGSSNDSKLDNEVNLINELGGNTIFTNSIKFSSTSIIDSIQLPHSEEFAHWVSLNFTEREISQVIEIINSFNKYSVIVIGDAIQDHYVTCSALGKSGKEPLLAFEAKTSETLEGGAIAIARNLERVIANLVLVTDYPNNLFVSDSLGENCNNFEVLSVQGNPSGFLRKTRYIDKVSEARLFLTYERVVHKSSVSDSNESAVNQEFSQLLDGFDITLISDFGHGVVTNLNMKEIKEKSKFIVMNSQLNASSRFPTPITSFTGSNMIILNRAELLWHYNGGESHFDSICYEVIKTTGCQYLIVTLGAEGLAIFFESSKIIVPAVGVAPRDRVGAGDSLLGISALCAISGLNPKSIGLVGNLVAALNIQQLGSKYKLQLSDLVVSLETVLAHVREK
jgi:rfaE bifunctional protein nucleotidyltransferase chain/domain